MMTELKGILGLEGREPIGAALTLGIKGPSGAPIHRDCFHIVSPRESEGRKRVYLPDFKLFNEAPNANRRTIRGNIVHATRDKCFEYHLKAQVQPDKDAHPDRKPFCIGDGKTAVRWMGEGADNFKEIKCPHDRCEFRQKTKKGIACKPWMRLVFRLSWDDWTQQQVMEGGRPPFPTPLTKFTSGSWRTTANVLGFFDFIETAAREMGVENYSLFGLPFLLNLNMQTKPSETFLFPVVSMTPLMDPIQFFRAQRAQLRELTAPVHEALTDESQQSNDVIAGDYEVISAGIPAGNGQ